MATLLQIVLLILSFCGLSMSVELVKAIHVNAGNLKEATSYLSPSGSSLGRVIHFSPGSSKETLMEVPIGKVHPLDTVVITVGLERSHYNTIGIDADPQIGIADIAGRKILWKIHDVNDYDQYPPCEMIDGEEDYNMVCPLTPVPGEFKFTFIPYKRFSFCQSAQNNGYINSGKFFLQLDYEHPHYLHLNRDDGYEEYNFFYFLVEVYTTLQDE